MFSQQDGFVSLRTGSHVRIGHSHRSPYAGRYGVISSVDAGDNKGPYLVRFEDGTQFRYRAEEIESAHTRTLNRFLGKIMKSHFQIFVALIAMSSLLLVAACSGPSPNPQPQPKAASAATTDSANVKETQERDAAVVEQRPAAIEKPRVQVTAKQKPPVREVPKQPVAPASVNAARPQATTAAPVETAASAGNTGLTLPSPVAPPIDVPAPPPEPKPAPVVEPEPRKVTVPSGTLVSIRMIDSVDSESAHAGETFKASLDAPIVVDNQTVFPKGSEVYVKVLKVESAGRVSGKSELQLQLDRIFLGKKSYTLESNSFVNTGASQAARTAKTGALGAAIGAAIGAISGGGKGAVIGGATGAGAGVGVEAVRKGEQVRVDSESRLDFRLEQSLEVTVLSPSPVTTQPNNNPSVPPRFGTRHQ